jgi:hypothetical protein
MATDSIDVFCPNCNILISAAIKATMTVSNHGDTVSELDMADAPYHSQHYVLALCGRCEGPFLVRQLLYGIPAEFESVTEETVLYPMGDRLTLSDIPHTVQRAHEQAVRAFNAALYEASTLMCRKALEAICQLKGASGGSLYDRLAALRQLGFIDARLLEWAHAIRLVGNDAAHDTDADVQKDDARDVLDLTEAILLYVFSLSARFSRFRTRRAEAR